MRMLKCACVALLLIPVMTFAETNGLVFWNRLGSQAEIESSEIGLNGTVIGGGFTNGMFGSAYVARYDEDMLVSLKFQALRRALSAHNALTFNEMMSVLSLKSCSGYWAQSF